MCKINISSRIFYSRFFPFFFFCFLLFFSFRFPFISVFLSFLFGFLFFLFFSFFTRRRNARANQGPSFSPRASPSHHRVPGVGPATNARISGFPLSLSRVVFTGQPEVCVKRTPEEQQPAVNPCGARHSDSISASLLASRARPSHRPITAVRSLHAKSISKPPEFKCEPKLKPESSP